MRLHNFINEKKISDDEAISILHKDCSDFFKNIQYGMKSFRGVKKQISDIIEKRKSRKNREPKDTDQKIHKKIDNWFYKKYKVKPRSEGIFVTQGYIDAEYYGYVYYFYPSNNFKVIWSNDIIDVYKTLLDDKIIGAWGKIKDKNWEKYLEKNILPTYKVGGPTKVNEALGSLNEVMFICNYYYLADVDFVSRNFDRIYKK